MSSAHYFLKIEGIDGDSKHPRYRKWIEVVNLKTAVDANFNRGTASNSTSQGTLHLELIASGVLQQRLFAESLQGPGRQAFLATVTRDNIEVNRTMLSGVMITEFSPPERTPSRNTEIVLYYYKSEVPVVLTLLRGILSSFGERNQPMEDTWYVRQTGPDTGSVGRR